MLTREEIKEYCLTVLGEINPMNEGVDESNNALPLLSVIDRFVEVGVNEAIGLLPDKYLSYVEIPGEIVARQDGSGYVVLPDDFSERICFEMKGWKRAVTRAVYEDSPVYAMQKCMATRGGVNRPVCVIVRGAEGYVLEYYSLPPFFRNPEVAKKWYVPRAVKRGEGEEGVAEFDLDREALPVIAYLVCKHVCEATGEMERSQYFSNEVVKQLELL